MTKKKKKKGKRRRKEKERSKHYRRKMEIVLRDVGKSNHVVKASHITINKVLKDLPNLTNQHMIRFHHFSRHLQNFG